MFSSPSIEASWYLVFMSTLPVFLSSPKVCGAPLNSSLLCINVTFAVLDNSNAQSKAESPPPNIEIVVSLNLDLSLIE